MSPPNNDGTSDTEEASVDERLQKTIQARFAHLSPEKRLRLKVELLRFLSQSVIMPIQKPDDGAQE